jgi:hypothetical protein
MGTVVDASFRVRGVAGEPTHMRAHIRDVKKSAFIYSTLLPPLLNWRMISAVDHLIIEICCDDAEGEEACRNFASRRNPLCHFRSAPAMQSGCDRIVVILQPVGD